MRQSYFAMSLNSRMLSPATQCRPLFLHRDDVASETGGVEPITREPRCIRKAAEMGDQGAPHLCAGVSREDSHCGSINSNLAIVPETKQKAGKTALQPSSGRPHLQSKRKATASSKPWPKGIRTPPPARNLLSLVEFDHSSLCRTLFRENQSTAERIFRTGNLLFFFSDLQTRPIGEN
jgi:hypothetical protein